jgi:AraC-like DNA-binding protein
MSSRSFARHFRATTGSTPHAWLLAQRVALAQELLESTDLSVDEVARRSGLGAATTLRHHFALRLGPRPRRTAGRSADRPARACRPGRRERRPAGRAAEHPSIRAFRAELRAVAAPGPVVVLPESRTPPRWPPRRSAARWVPSPTACCSTRRTGRC